MSADAPSARPESRRSSRTTPSPCRRHLSDHPLLDRSHTRPVSARTPLASAHTTSPSTACGPQRSAPSATSPARSAHGGSSTSDDRSSGTPHPAQPTDPAHRLPPPIAAHSDPDPSSSSAHRTNSPCSHDSQAPYPATPSLRPPLPPPRIAAQSSPCPLRLPGTLRPPRCRRTCTRPTSCYTTPDTPTPTCSSTSRSRSDSMPQSLPPTHETQAQSLRWTIPPGTTSETDPASDDSCAHIA